MNSGAVTTSGASLPMVLGLLQELGLPAQAVMLVILGAFLVGAWAALVMWRRLRRERTALEAVRERYPRARQRATARDMDMAQALTAGVLPADASICRRIDDLQTIRDNGGEINREALAATTVARLSLRMNLLRYVTSILILIGLMGTLIGLTQAVIGLSAYQAPAETSGGVSVPGQGTPSGVIEQRLSHLYAVVTNLFTSIEQTLAGMRTAFLASLIAVALTLVLSGCTHSVQNRQTLFLADLEDFTTRELVPFFLPPRPETTLQKLAESIQDGTEQFLTTVEEIDDRADKVGSNLEYLFMLVREFDAGRQRFETSLERMTDNRSSLMEAQQQIERIVRRFLEAVDRLGSTEAIIRQAVELVRTFCQENAGLGSSVKQGIELQQAFQRELNQFAALCEDLLDRRLTGLLSQHHERLSTWSTTQERLAQTLIQTSGQGITLQQTANGLLHQLLERQDKEQQISAQQMAQLLTHQRQSAEGIAHIIKLLELQQATTRSLEETFHQSIVVHQAAIDTVKELVRASTEEGIVLSPGGRAAEAMRDLPLEEAMHPVSRDVLQLLDRVLLKERKLFGARLQELAALQSDYFQASLEQQRHIAKSLELIQTATARAAESQGFSGLLRGLFVKGDSHASDPRP